MPDNERVRFRRGMRSEAGHEAATNFQHRRSIVLRGGFDIWQCESHYPDYFEGIRLCTLCLPLFHLIRLSVPLVTRFVPLFQQTGFKWFIGCGNPVIVFRWKLSEKTPLSDF